MLKKSFSVLLALIVSFSAMTCVPFSAIVDTAKDGQTEIASENISGFSDDRFLNNEAVNTNNAFLRSFEELIEDTEPESAKGNMSAKDADLAATGAELIVDGIKYSVSGSSATVVGYTTAVSSALVIPSQIPNTSYKVTTIGKSAFSGCTSISSVIIPGSVTSIKPAAFLNCSSLTTLTLKEGLQTIEYGDAGGAFQNCTSLKKLVIPDTVTEIGARSFINCSAMENVTIGSGVKTIGYKSSISDYNYGAFSGCKSLTGVTIKGNSLEMIGKDTFNGCTALSSINIPNSVTLIYKRAFKDCVQLRSITIPGSVTFIGPAAFMGCTSLATLTLKEGLQTIEYGDAGGAFQKCTSLKELVIPNSVTAISARAFMDCTSLQKVTIGSGLKTLGYMKQPNIYDYGVFENCTSLDEVFILQGNLEYIGIQSFKNCTSLRKITIPGNVKQIGAAISTSDDKDLVDSSQYSAAFLSIQII